MSDVPSEPPTPGPSGRSTQLAAIVFTDIAGYSRMMEHDEERTIEVLQRHNGIVLPLVEQHGGEVVDAIGDGLFLLFPTLRDAVGCSITIQQSVARHNEQTPAEQRFRLRIGIHLGEIWRDRERVYGNGVNIAARVQPFAEPGGICITEDVYRQVSNKLSAEMRSIGRHELRNISRRLELYRVVTGSETAGETSEHASERGGELDAIKQRILEEREEVARRRRDAGSSSSSSFEQRIESKVYSLVEKVMDTAITKWDGLPEEKKDKLIGRLKSELDEKSGDLNIRIPASGSSSDDGDDDDGDPGTQLRERLGVGLIFGGGFGIGYFGFGIGWMIWPFLILGVLPFSFGILKAIKIVSANRRAGRERPFELERTILAAARRLGGTVTVVQVAAEAQLTLDEVQQTLDRLTAKGYVSQEVRDSGIVVYEFPSLGPSAAGDRRGD